MTREFIYTSVFLKCWAAMGLNDDDLTELENFLLINPLRGDTIEGMNGARKLRIQLSGRGKRGGGRVIYLDILTEEKLYMLFAYPKNVQTDLTQNQKKSISNLVKEIKRGD